MPELPEVETVARELNRSLPGRRILSVEVRAPKIAALGPGVLSPKRAVSPKSAREFQRILAGQKFLSVTRRAKLLIFRLSGPWSMLVHLKMTGQFIFEDRLLRRRTGGKYRLLNRLSAPRVSLPAKHTHVVWRFADGSVLYFNDVRKFGYLKLVRDSELGQVREFREYGPEPLAKNFSFGEFKQRVKKRPGGKIKQVLMDNKVVVGIGNIYSDEILFHAGIRPERKVSALSEKELRAIYGNIMPVLRKAILAKGSSVGDFVRTDGSWGKMGKHHFVYGRKGEKCQKCGTMIASLKLGGRTGSFCPQCQK